MWPDEEDPDVTNLVTPYGDPLVEETPEEAEARARKAELIKLAQNEIPGGFFWPPESYAPPKVAVPQPKPRPLPKQVVEEIIPPIPQAPPTTIDQLKQKPWLIQRPVANIAEVTSNEAAPQPRQGPVSVPAPAAQGGVPAELSRWIMKKEGWAPTAFDDYGQHNIGYGTNARGRTSITKEEAYAEMNAELAKHLASLDRLNPRIPPAIRNSLASLSFNVGDRWMTEQGNNLQDAVRNGDWARAREWFVKYNKAGGTPLGGLITRRNQEAEAFNDPNYYHSGKGTTSTEDWGGTPDPEHVASYGSARSQTFAGGSANPGNMAYLASLGAHNVGSGVVGHPVLISALTQAAKDYEAATGQKARFGEMGRDVATQAKYYANYLAGRGGLAAPPGRSRHQGGNAVDVPMGAFNAWLKANAAKYGLETLKGSAYERDKVHFQLIGTAGGGAPRGPDAAQTEIDPTQPGSVSYTNAGDDERQQRLDEAIARLEAAQQKPEGWETPKPLLTEMLSPTPLGPPQQFSWQGVPWMNQPAAPKPEPEASPGAEVLRNMWRTLMKMQDNPPAAKTGVETEPGLLDLLTKHLGKQYDVPNVITEPGRIGEAASKVGRAAADIPMGAVHAGQGMAAGALQLPNLAVVPAGQILAAASKTLPFLQKPAEWLNFTVAPAITEWARGNAGLTEDFLKANPAAALGEFGGQLASAGGPIGAGIAGASLIGGPEIEKFYESLGASPDLSPISPAYGVDKTSEKGVFNVKIDSQGRLVAQTVAGQVHLPQHSVDAMGWAGITTLGFMASPFLLRRSFRATSPQARPIAGVPGSAGMDVSGARDVFVASNLSYIDPLKRMHEQHYNELTPAQLNPANGISPLTAQEVGQTLHIFSNSGQRNMIAAAIEKGEMRASGSVHPFSVPGGITWPQIREFAKGRPEFEPYLAAKIKLEQMEHNQRGMADMVSQGHSAQRAGETFPQAVTDPHMVAQSIASLKAEVAAIEARNPDFPMATRPYAEYIAAGRRFISEGEWAPENTGDLRSTTTNYPLTPYFYDVRVSTPSQPARNVRNTAWERIRLGESPLYVAEQALSDSMSHRLSNEGMMTYITALPPGKHFRDVSREKNFFRDKTVDPDTILKVDVQGVTHTFIGPKTAVFLLKNEPAGALGGWDTLLQSTKQLFQKSTTNIFAPHFATTSAIRTWRQSMITVADLNPPRQGVSKFAPFSYFERPERGPLSYLPEKLFDPMGVKGEARRVGPVALAMEVPRMLGPKLAELWRPLTESIVRELKSTRLGAALGPQVELIGRILTGETARAFNHEAEMWGGMNKSWITAADERRDSISKASRTTNNANAQGVFNYLGRVTRKVSDMWHGDPVMEMMANGELNVKGWKGVPHYGRMTGNAWADLWSTIANAPNTAWARKNQNMIDPITKQKITMDKLMMLERDLTGDPSNRGAFAFRPRPGFGSREDISYGVPFQTEGATKTQLGMNAASRGMGRWTDRFHNGVPWAGTLIRSPGRTIAAMSTNPIRANMWLLATQMMPEAVVYMYNSSVSPDHVNYMMEGRSPWQINNNTYIAREGRPPEEGWEIPDFQEGLPFRRAFVVALDQMFGRSPFTFAQDKANFWKSFVSTNLAPPYPSLLGAGVAAMGGTIWDGEIKVWNDNTIRDIDEYDNAIERLGRAFAPTVGNYMINFYKSWWMDNGGDDPENYRSLLSPHRVGKGLEEVGKTFVRSTPILRDVLGMRHPASASNRMTESMFEEKRKIESLSKFYNQQVMMRDQKTRQGYVGWSNSPFDPKGEGEAIQRQYTDFIPQHKFEVPGFKQPDVGEAKGFHEAIQAMDMLMKRDRAGSFGTLMNARAGWSRAIESMRAVRSGNEALWLSEKHKTNPQELEAMEKAGVNTKDYTSVLSYYVTQRRKLEREMYYYLKAAEQTIDQLPEVRKELKKTGEHFEVGMAYPYKSKIFPYTLGIEFPWLQREQAGRLTGATGDTESQ